MKLAPDKVPVQTGSSLLTIKDLFVRGDKGKTIGIVKRENATRSSIGLMMTGEKAPDS